MIAEAIAILRPSSTFGITNDDFATLKWNDSKINYKWSIKKPKLSKRDK